MSIKMVRPRLMKSMGKVGNKQYYRFELVGNGLIDVVCHTLAENLEGVKTKAASIIAKFKERQVQVLHAKFKNGINN